MKKNIEIIGKFYDNHSLAIINREVAIRLGDEEVFPNINLTITPVDQFNSVYKIKKDHIKKLKELESKESKPDIQIRHTYPPIWRWPVSDKTKIVYIQPWEYTKIPFEWQYKFEQFADYLITPSQWSINNFLDAGLSPKKAGVVANGYDPQIFNTDSRIRDPHYSINNKFTFIFVGNAQYRKGLDILLNAWQQATKLNDNVKLIFKDSPQIYGETDVLNRIIQLQYKTVCAEIEYIDKILSNQEMADLYKQSEVLIHPYRGEGFGMHVQEAMATGCIPMVTAGGPTDDFLTNQNSVRINSAMILQDITADHIFAIKPGDALTMMGAHGTILEPDVSDLVNKITQIIQHPQREKVMNQLRDAEKTLHTWDKVAISYAEFIKKIDCTTKNSRD
jgi:glycosyltransferase involved in cell wall biosynthesis